MRTDGFLTLPSLPGGNEQYLKTIEIMLRFLHSSVARTREELATWMMAKYGSSRKAVDGHIQSLTRLGLIERKQHHRLSVTPSGLHLLKVESPEAKAVIVLEKLLPNYVAIFHILRWFAQSDVPIDLVSLTEKLTHQFPELSSFDHVSRRLYWLTALGCVQQIGSRRIYAITAFGREVVARFEMESGGDADRTFSTLENRLIQQLHWAARHTEEPELFEAVMGDVLDYLGYHVSHIGGSGEPDLVVRALLGQESYTFIVDTKARHDGKLHNIDVTTIRGHCQEARADFAVVVAESFSGEKIRQHALDNHITLLPTELIEKWILLHQVTPINLAVYRSMVEQAGLISTFPQQLVQQSEIQIRRFQLLKRVLHLFQRAYEINSDIQWTIEQVHSNLAMEYYQERYNRKEVEDVVRFLTNPIIGAASEASGGLVLSMRQAGLNHLLYRLAASLDDVT